MGVHEFWFRDWFVLGMRTFCEGGVMIRWFGPLGRLWRPTCHTILDGVGVVAFRGNLVKNVVVGVYNHGFCGGP